MARRLKWAAIPLALLAVALWLFPGQRLTIAFTLATGVGRDGLQSRIDALEDKAIRRTPLSTDERELLSDFYGTLATGGKLTIVARQTGHLMDHYLARSGADYGLEPVIFTGNQNVQTQAQALRKRVAAAGCPAGKHFSSPRFYMPHPSNIDSVFGLYHGTLHVTSNPESNGRCRLHFRAEVPWRWPSYASLARKYGDPHAESFPLPSLRSLAFGQEHSLFVDNGLGHHLEEVGLAKSFLAYSEWDES